MSKVVQAGSPELISTVPPLFTMALSPPLGIVPPQLAALLYEAVPPVQNRSTAWVETADNSSSGRKAGRNRTLTWLGFAFIWHFWFARVALSLLCVGFLRGRMAGAGLLL